MEQELSHNQYRNKDEEYENNGNYNNNNDDDDDDAVKCLKQLFLSNINIEHDDNDAATRSNAAQQVHGQDCSLDKRNRKKDQIALLVLNCPIYSKLLFESVWPIAKYRIFADGAANRVYDLYEHSDPAIGDNDRTHAYSKDKDSKYPRPTKPRTRKRSDFLPDAIHGDLDSIRDDVKQWYEAHSVKVTREGDQYSTDFGKATDKICNHFGSSATATQVIVMGSLAGRVDHGIGILHEFYRIDADRPQLRLWLASEMSISFLLRAGSKNQIPLRNTPHAQIRFEKSVGILPIYGPATVSTRGLEWDVQNWDTRMGGNVSTSNHIVDEQGLIHVETDRPVLFTVEISLHDSSY